MNKTSASTMPMIGAILLIAGCCIGAGMLGLPVLTAQAGFKPSLIMFIVGWLFMVTTGLLMLEVNLWFGPNVSFISMAEKTLGKAGKIVCWSVFLFLFYCLMVAYISGTGSLFAGFYERIFGGIISDWLGSVIFILIFGILVFLGTQATDRFNRFLMGGLILSYVGLVALGSRYVQMENLMHQDWKAATFVLPVMIVSFGYHNLIPSLTTYLKGNVSQLRKAIIIGSSLPLLIYIIWEWLILGIIPLHGEGGFLQALNEGSMATQALRAIAGSSWVVTCADYFAFFAIVTSFLAVALSFVDFLADGLHLENRGKGRFGSCLLVFLPPLLLAYSYPKLFLTALSYAGAFGAVVLFGILPALMVWSGRYYRQFGWKKIVPGEKYTLAAVIAISLAIMILQLAIEIQA